MGVGLSKQAREWKERILVFPFSEKTFVTGASQTIFTQEPLIDYHSKPLENWMPYQMGIYNALTKNWYFVNWYKPKGEELRVGGTLRIKIPEEFTGKFLWFINIRNRNYLVGHVPGSKKRFFGFAGDEESSPEFLNFILPKEGEGFVGAYTSTRGMMGIYRSKDALWQLPINSVKSAPEILTGTEVAAKPVSSYIQALFWGIKSETELKNRENQLREEIEKKPGLDIHTQLFPYGYFPLDIKTNKFKVQICVNIKNDEFGQPTKAVLVEFQDFPEIWTGSGEVYIEGSIMGSRSILRAFGKVFAKGKVLGPAESMQEVPEFPQKPPKGFFTVKEGEHPKGILLQQNELYVLWANKKGSAIGYERIPYLKSLSEATFYKIGRPRFFVRDEIFETFEESFRQVIIKPGISL